MLVQNLMSSNSVKNLRELSILIIEDDPISAEVLKIALQNLGIAKIVIAKTGDEAIQLFSEKLDIILTDFHLPDMNGIQIVQYYRKIFPKRDTPIICCSTEIENIRTEGIAQGIDDFLNKPVNIEELQSMLECWVSQFIQKKISQSI